MATPINGGTRGLWIDPHQVGKAATAADKVAEPPDVYYMPHTPDLTTAAPR